MTRICRGQRLARHLRHTVFSHPQHMEDNFPKEVNFHCGPVATETVQSTVIQCNQATGDFLVRHETGEETVPHALIHDSLRTVSCPLEKHVDESLAMWQSCLHGQQDQSTYQQRWKETLTQDSVVDVLQWDGETFANAKLRNYIPENMLEEYGLPNNFYLFDIERGQGDHNFYTTTAHSYFFIVKLSGSTVWKVVRLQTLVGWVESFITSTWNTHTTQSVTDEQFEAALLQVFSTPSQTPANTPEMQRSSITSYDDPPVLEFPQPTRRRMRFNDDSC